MSSLKNCWDILKCENKTFLTLVTSAFPCAKDQEAILNELRTSGFQHVFEYVRTPNGPLWGCFLCNHPEKAVGFLQVCDQISVLKYDNLSFCKLLLRLQTLFSLGTNSHGEIYFKVLTPFMYTGYNFFK